MNQRHQTADRLVRVAARLFADRGYDRASVRAITQAGRANLGAVTYHFGSKAKLYDAVIDQLLGGMADRVAAAALVPGPAATRLEALVQAVFGFFADHPEAPRIILQALARGGPPDSALPHLRRNLETFSRVFLEGQSAGQLRAVDPFLATFTVLSQCVWFVVAGPTIARTAGRRLDDAATVQRVAQHIADVAVRAFRPEGAALS